MKDIAQKYRISRQLVGKLCRDAESKPEELTKRRDMKQNLEDKREAIEAVT